MKKEKTGRPPLPKGKKRVHISATVDPQTSKALRALQMPGQSLGQVLDDIAGINKE